VTERRTIPKPPDRERWLEVRRPYFNASSTAILFDRHPYLTPGDYATVKLTGEEQTPTRAMRRGIALEDAIGQWWAMEHACSVGDVDDLYIAGRVMATVDKWALDDDCPIEIKTANHRAFEPERYWLDQCQSIMLCTDRDACWLVWFDPSMDLHEKLIGGDPELQAEILKRSERFMAAIDLGIVPDWIELSYQNIAALHPQSKPAAVALDDEGLAQVQALAMCRQLKRDAEKDEASIKDHLAKKLLDAESGTYDGLEILTWRTTKPSYQVDVEMLTADHPDLVERYRREKPGTRRMLTRLEMR
jgi:predicted phage-related endonuclease